MKDIMDDKKHSAHTLTRSRLELKVCCCEIQQSRN